MVVKENQPPLDADSALRCADPPPGEAFARVRQADRHGDRTEVRPLWASPALRGYRDWPGIAQVSKVERRVHRKGKRPQAVRYAVTRLAHVAAARRL